ncbi:hypothetical protein G7058_00055 [Jeotgalibaca porci]|uniref:Uncharacterized protein n=1 Tax=Jeotgalibaca porci TaxID=1868793 RepID=A0A6G7WEA8_9LACT|nr:hypothetical protein [Jeotgalibaca porci]QIK50591.1 hypothetical protein G7058_00055 [Jeotgalibaca porci]
MKELMPGVWQFTHDKPLTEVEWQARRKHMREELKEKKAEAVSDDSSARYSD